MPRPPIGLAGRTDQASRWRGATLAALLLLPAMPVAASLPPTHGTGATERIAAAPASPEPLRLAQVPPAEGEESRQAPPAAGPAAVPGLFQPVAELALLAVIGLAAALLVRARQRRLAERAALLAESEARFRSLFSAIDEGYCLCEMVLDAEGRPVDYRFLEVNPLFEAMTGLAGATGRTALELRPDLELRWIETYGRVALGGEPLRFESGSEAMGRWFDVFAAPVAPRGRFALVFRDITGRRSAEAALRESEARFRAMADNIPQLAWMARPDGAIFWYNRRWLDHTGTTLEEMQGWGWRRVHHPDHLERVEAEFRRCIALGEPWEDTFPLRGKDGEYRWFLSRAEPIRDAGGEVALWFGTNTDVTEQRRAEEGNARLAALVASAGDAIISFAAADGHIQSWNRGAEALFGYTEAEALDAPVGLLVPPELPEGDPSGVFAWAMSGRPVRDHETVRLAKGGERIPVSITAAPMVAPDGRVIGVSGIFRDLRARKANEERQALLMREVDHRAKNALAVVQSVLRLTRAPDQRSYVATVEGRIAALGRAHGLLAQGRWSGAELRRIAEEELQAYRGEGRVALSGPAVHLAAEAVQPLAMVLHELATNAAKYGALSQPEGRLGLSWEIDPGTGGLRLAWEERGGPPLRGPPTRSGFGSTLIEATLRGQLGGELRYDWAREGLRCAITIAARHLRPTSPAVPEPAPEPGTGPATPLAGCRVLVAEDEALVALELEQALEALGCTVLGPAATLPEALWLAASDPPPEAAVLDINLGGKASFPVADLLAGLGVPVLYASGYGELPPERAGQAPLLRKPLGREELALALRRLLAGRAEGGRAPAPAERRTARAG